jgi:hypothetical protein
MDIPHIKLTMMALERQRQRKRTGPMKLIANRNFVIYLSSSCHKKMEFTSIAGSRDK